MASRDSYLIKDRKEEGGLAFPSPFSLGGVAGREEQLFLTIIEAQCLVL